MEANQTKFDRIVIRNNSKKILIIGSVYAVFEIIGLTLSTLGFFESDIRLFVAIVVLFHLIYLPILYVCNYKIVKISFKLISILELIYFPVIIVWASVFNVLMYIEHEDITIYSIVVLLFAAIFIIRPSNSNLLFGGALLFFSILIYQSSIDVLVANGLVFKAAIVTLLSYVVARTNYSIRKRLHDANDELLNVNQKLRNQVIRDSLTGLYNNGYAFDYIDRAIEKSIKSKSELSVIMLDIDDFKRINDNYGHLVGDIVIQKVAEIIQNSIGELDIAARYGGEEFIVVLNNSEELMVKRIAERIRSDIETFDFEFEEKITMSLGISTWDKDTKTNLIKKADDNLYRAKNEGKNQVC